MHNKVVYVQLVLYLQYESPVLFLNDFVLLEYVSDF
jgi:hypothetical protein